MNGTRRPAGSRRYQIEVPDVSRAVEMLVTECYRWLAKTVVEILFEDAEIVGISTRYNRDQEIRTMSSDNEGRSVKHFRIKKEGRQKAHAPHVAG